MSHLKKIIALAFSLLIGMGVANAISQCDLLITGSPNAVSYPGYPSQGTANIQVVNTSNASAVEFPTNPGLPVPFIVTLSLPVGMQFNASYPGLPVGWTYSVSSDGQTATLTPLVTLNFTAFPTTNSSFTFNVPFTNLAPVTGQTYLFQIQGTGPTNNDINSANNSVSGVVSVSNTPLGSFFQSFEAKADACSSDLTWITTDEKNGAEFRVERSGDGSNYKTIGTIKVKGNDGQSLNHYNFVDANPMFGKNFYRIAQVDLDGTSVTTKSELVNMSCNGVVISVYPNPTTGVLYVKGMEDKGTIEVYNVLGQVVLKKETQNTMEAVNLTGLADGSYQINVLNSSRTIFTTKVIKNNK